MRMSLNCMHLLSAYYYYRVFESIKRHLIKCKEKYATTGHMFFGHAMSARNNGAFGNLKPPVNTSTPFLGDGFSFFLGFDKEFQLFGRQIKTNSQLKLKKK